MMKAKLLLFLFCLCAVTVMAQEPLCRKCRKAISQCPYNGKHPTEKKCAKCGKLVSQCPYKGKHPVEKKCAKCGRLVSQCPYKGKHPKERTCAECGQVISQCPYQGNHPVPEAEGYDVTFTCNVSSASLYVDGVAYGAASGICHLKTGKHAILVKAADYPDYTQNITVNRQNRSFQIKMEKESEAEGYDVTFTCNVSSASLSVDGVAYGAASGTCHLKTGTHSILVKAEDYLDYTQRITVNRQSRSFQIVLEKKPVEVSYSNHTLRIGNIVYNMKRVDGGTFTMGATSEMSKPSYDEKPKHQVTLSSYSIGETEVTQALWQAVMGSNPSHFKGDNLPVEQVSWDDCREFIRKLNTLTGQRFRLPTEAEWEFAARGGNRSNHTQYSGSSRIEEVAWYEDNSGQKTHPVKTKKANELGLYDMTGNVREWCQDGYGKYSKGAQNNPIGPGSGSYRVIRGGSWGNTPWYCRSSDRKCLALDACNYDLGLRLALSE